MEAVKFWTAPSLKPPSPTRPLPKWGVYDRNVPAAHTCIPAVHVYICPCICVYCHQNQKSSPVFWTSYFFLGHVQTTTWLRSTYFLYWLHVQYAPTFIVAGPGSSWRPAPKQRTKHWIDIVSHNLSTSYYLSLQDRPWLQKCVVVISGTIARRTFPADTSDTRLFTTFWTPQDLSCPPLAHVFCKETHSKKRLALCELPLWNCRQSRAKALVQEGETHRVWNKWHTMTIYDCWHHDSCMKNEYSI